MVDDDPTRLDGDEADENDDPRYSSDPNVRREFYLAEGLKSIDEAVACFLSGLGKIYSKAEKAVESGSYYSIACDLRKLPNGGELLQELYDVIQVKGFRDDSVCMTPQEHDNCGSSIWNRLREFGLDVPCGVAAAKLQSSGVDIGEEKTLTIPETDISRRLSGGTKLDLETGRVTDKRDDDAAKDSFHFVELADRPALIARQAAFLDSVRRSVDGLQERVRSSYDQARAGFERFMEGQLSVAEITEFLSGFNSLIGGNERITNEMRQSRFDSGCVDWAMTLQEVSLGYAPGEINDKYDGDRMDAYMAIGFQFGDIDLDRIRSFREGEGVMIINSFVNGQYKRPFGFSFEALGDDGRTAKDPVVLGNTEPFSPLSDAVLREICKYGKPYIFFERENQI